MLFYSIIITIMFSILQFIYSNNDIHQGLLILSWVIIWRFLMYIICSLVGMLFSAFIAGLIVHIKNYSLTECIDDLKKMFVRTYRFSSICLILICMFTEKHMIIMTHI